jgi:hypothetical protein
MTVKKRVAVEDFLSIPFDSGRTLSFRVAEAGRATMESRRVLRRASYAAIVALCLGPLGLADDALGAGLRAAALILGG